MARHPRLAPAAAYASAFGPEALGRLEEDLLHFYREEDLPFLQERLEFSLVPDTNGLPHLRYELNRLFHPDRILSRLAQEGLDIPEAARFLGLFQGIAPEFGVGVDQTPGRRRMKLYAMRLDPARGRLDRLIPAVLDLAGGMGIPPALLRSFPWEDITLVAMDLHPGCRPDLKLYTLHPFHPGAVEEILSPWSLASPVLSCITALAQAAPRGEWGPLFRYLRLSPGETSPSGLNLVFGLQPRAWPAAEPIFLQAFPSQAAIVKPLFGRVRSMGWEVSVCHIGSSFSLSSGEESLHLYFSVI